MKGRTWKSLKGILVPDCMKHLELDSRGYPIPFTVTRDSKGKPDFRVIDQQKWGECVVYRRCGLTGLPLGDLVAFVGGQKSMLARMFSDAGMLPDAAEYAMQVCPFIAAPKFGYSKIVPAVAGHGTAVNPLVSLDRPDVFCMGVTRDYQLVQVQGTVAIQAAPFVSVQMWRQGVRVNSLGE